MSNCERVNRRTVCVSMFQENDIIEGTTRHYASAEGFHAFALTMETARAELFRSLDLMWHLECTAEELPTIIRIGGINKKGYRVVWVNYKAGTYCGKKDGERLVFGCLDTGLEWVAREEWERACADEEV